MNRTESHDELEQVASRMGEMLDKLWRWHADEFCRVDTWEPPVNVYRLEKRFEVCVDLAGLQPRSIDIRVEPGRLTLRGIRAAPEPRREGESPMHIVSMEINHGEFCRTIGLPAHVELARVESEYNNGWLWIRLPLREQA